ncbi:MAG: polyphosphate kinase 1 [Methanocalculaceae archaeon]|jgi:polyphosphate kinase|nr:polyphosphate kinase 1 [Methanocalculaceae archaeon]
MNLANNQHPSNPLNLKDKTLYINREFSLIQFNRRVLEEATNLSHPLLERVKFLSIFVSNVDEFMMIRVSGLLRQIYDGVLERPPDGLTPTEQIQKILEAIIPLQAEACQCWGMDLKPALEKEGIFIHKCKDVEPGLQEYLRKYFEKQTFPILTPLTFDGAHPFPFISNLSLNLAVVINHPTRGQVFSRVKVPTGTLARFIRIPNDLMIPLAKNPEHHYVTLEDVIASNIEMLFPGMEIKGTYVFRVTRDADIEIEEDEAADLLTAIESRVGQRRIGTPSRIEVTAAMPEWIRDLLSTKLRLMPTQIYISPSGLIGMNDLMELIDIDRPDLKNVPFRVSVPACLAKDSLPAAISSNDLLLYHPYDSFGTVVEFVQQAAHDPNVLAIKQTLYRSGKNSPIVHALIEACEEGKSVTVLIELKARFDEVNNIEWARVLERAGAHVIYGVAGLKVHAKMCMVVRRERNKLRIYTHMGTGNYNAATACIYADLSMFTCDPDIGADIADLFNALTGYSKKISYRKLLVSYGTMGMMREDLIAKINREIERQKIHGDGYLAFKLNALVDTECIIALYRASQAGVKIDLVVRGVCCLRPEVPGVSENIRVISIVGRFLEHTRVYYFRNGGDEEVLLGSADLMTRNLSRRVEILFPVENPYLRNMIIHTILETHIKDTVQAQLLHSDGSYEKVLPAEGEEPLDSQKWMMEHCGIWHDY